MQPSFDVDTPGVQAMAARWGAWAGELNATVAPVGLGLSFQLSAAAVDAAHRDVAAFTAGLVAQMGMHATRVTQADARYCANEAASATELAAVAQLITSE